MNLLRSLAVIGLAFGFVCSASATPLISLSAAGATTSSLAGATTIDFNNGCGYASCSGDYIIASGNLSGKYAQPAGVDSPFLSVPNPSASTLSASFSLGTLANYFGLFWGSIDSYNGIRFLLGDQLVASFSGSDLVGHYANGDQVSLNSNRYINFDFGSDAFDSVQLFSNGYAFESDNHAFRTLVSVTEPAPMLLMALGLLSLALMRRRRTQA